MADESGRALWRENLKRIGGLRSPLAQKKLRVLIADADVDYTASLSMLAGFWGHEAWVAHDGRAALALAIQQPPDVVIADIALALMRGCDLAQALRCKPALKRTLLID